MRRFDAAIVGAGPAGSAAAILLARAGWRVALVERQRFPRRKVCGECIAATNLPLLDALGVGDAVRNLAGAELRRVALCAAAVGGRRAARRDRPSATLRPCPRPRAPRHLAGGARRAPAVSTCCSPGPASPRGRAGSIPPSACARRRAEASRPSSRPPWPSPRTARGSRCRPSGRAAAPRAGRATCSRSRPTSATWPRPDLLPVLSLPGGYGGMVIADDGLATLACCVREDRLDRERDASRASAAPATRSKRCCGASAPAWPRR